MALIDIVNNEDEVEGWADRERVHDNGWLHRVSLVLVINSKNETLYTKSSDKKSRERGWIPLIGEHLKKGEKYRKAAVRGLKEELDLSINPFNLQYLSKGQVDLTGVEGFPSKEIFNYRLYGMRYVSASHNEIKPKNEISNAEFRDHRYSEVKAILERFPRKFVRNILNAAKNLKKII